MNISNASVSHRESASDVTRTYTVQEAAERTGLSVHTLRYYERAGLIPSVGRDESSGHRRYTEGDIGAIVFLKRMRATGMPIREMQRYVALVREGDDTVGARKAMLEKRRAAVCQQIEELTQTLAVIDFKINSYACLTTEASDAVNCTATWERDHEKGTVIK
jgi:DNA-binding transcriptional MerR regulator